MKIYETENYEEMSRKSGKYSFRTGNFETGLCTRSCNGIYTDRNIR